jgi:hypothetical protein
VLAGLRQHLRDLRQGRAAPGRGEQVSVAGPGGGTAAARLPGTGEVESPGERGRGPAGGVRPGRPGGDRSGQVTAWGSPCPGR